MKNLTLVIPAKQEEDSLPIVLNEIADLDCKKFVVLHSTDFKTLETIKNFDCKINVTLKKDDLETIESIKKNHNVNIFYQSGNGYGNALKEAIISCQTKYFCIFNADGSFQNVQGEETWLEPWQGSDPEACGSPVDPHNGSNPATLEYNDASGEVTLTGLGA